MNNEAIDAKLKHLGSSIDKVRDDVKEVKSDMKEFRKEALLRGEKVTNLVEIQAADHIQIATNKNDIRDIKMLVWKLLASLAVAGVTLDKIFN